MLPPGKKIIAEHKMGLSPYQSGPLPAPLTAKLEMTVILAVLEIFSIQLFSIGQHVVLLYIQTEHAAFCQFGQTWQDQDLLGVSG